MISTQRRPRSLALRVWLLIALVVLASSMMACSQTANSQQTETAQQHEGRLVLNAPYRPDVDVPPQITNPAGRIFLAPLLGGAFTSDGDVSTADLQEIHVQVTVPPVPFDVQTLTRREVLDDAYLEQMSFVLVGPAGSAEMQLDFPESLYVEPFEGETVIHGLLDGFIFYEGQPAADMLMILAIIPERQRGRFNININPRDDNMPVVVLPFGALEFTPELTELVRR